MTRLTKELCDTTSPMNRPETEARELQEKRRFISTARLAEITGEPVEYWAKKRLDGSGPPYFKIRRRVFYDIRAFEAWVRKNTRQSTSDTGQPQEPA